MVIFGYFHIERKGSGIELSLSRQIIRNYGSELRIHSEMKKGTICDLILPELV